MTIKSEDRSLYGKKVCAQSFQISAPLRRSDEDSLLKIPKPCQYAHCKQPMLTYFAQGREGIIIVKTKQALLIGHYPESVQPGNATNVVEKLADYLIGVGY